MPTEADTCRTLITPTLQEAGWDTDPASIAEQRYFTAGRIVVRGNQAERRKGKRADYAAEGEVQFTLPDVLKVPPISVHGNVTEVPQRFGGFEQLGNAVKQLQTLVYAA
jgi:hypothetical protein